MNCQALAYIVVYSILLKDCSHKLYTNFLFTINPKFLKPSTMISF